MVNVKRVLLLLVAFTGVAFTGCANDSEEDLFSREVVYSKEQTVWIGDMPVKEEIVVYEYEEYDDLLNEINGWKASSSEYKAVVTFGETSGEFVPSKRKAYLEVLTLTTVEEDLQAIAKTVYVYEENEWYVRTYVE